MKICKNGSKEVVFEVGMLLEDEQGEHLKRKILKKAAKRGLAKGIQVSDIRVFLNSGHEISSGDNIFNLKNEPFVFFSIGNFLGLFARGGFRFRGGSSVFATD